MRKDNRGLSLLELVVSIAILGMVSAILVSFMSTGSAMFKRVSTDVSLQMQSQMLATQLTEYIIDCNESIEFSGGQGAAHLTVRNTTPGGIVEHRFDWNGTTGIVTYNDKDEMAEYVSFLGVEITGNTVTLTLHLAKDEDFYVSTHTVALRNDSVRVPTP